MITGAATGLGQAIAVALAQNGADVVISDLDTERLEETEGLIRETGRKILRMALDVRNPEHIAAAAVYLASEEASLVNCETHRVDGGWTAW